MDGNVEYLLKAILDELQLLTVKTKTQAVQRFNAEFLTSDLRRQMYEAFDGQRTLQQISADTGCKINTLQIFAQSLVEKDLVNFEVQGSARIFSKALSKIAIYYANRELEEANGQF